MLKRLTNFSLPIISPYRFFICICDFSFKNLQLGIPPQTQHIQNQIHCSHPISCFLSYALYFGEQHPCILKSSKPFFFFWSPSNHISSTNKASLRDGSHIQALTAFPIGTAVAQTPITSHIQRGYSLPIGLLVPSHPRSNHPTLCCRNYCS